MSRAFSFLDPTDLHTQVANEIGASALALDGGTQTSILSYFPTGGTTWSTLAQLNTSNNLVRTLYDGAMNTARATKSPDSVALVNAKWDGLCGSISIFDAARSAVLRAANPGGV